MAFWEAEAIVSILERRNEMKCNILPKLTL